MKILAFSDVYLPKSLAMIEKKEITRRRFLGIGFFGVIGSFLYDADKVESSIMEKSKETLVYIGTYTNTGKSRGIYIYRFDEKTGALTPYKIVENVVDPSFLAIDKKRKFLYAVNETENYEGKKSGAVSSFKIADDGDLQFLNQRASLGGAPCHLTVSDNEKYVLLANYSGGNIAVFPLGKDGQLGESAEFIQHRGSSVNKKRQESAHAHSINLDHKNHFAYVCDLGVDKVFIYQFDDKTGKLVPNPAQEFFQTAPGAGPRHFTFHPNNKFAFLINELDSTIISLACDAKQGTLRELQTISALPENYQGTSYCADIHVSPNGKFLYGSNRGHDSIAAYKIDEENGLLELLGFAPTGGKYPRNFAIAPNGEFLLAANQNSDNVTVFKVNENGTLEPTPQNLKIPSPVCLKFAHI